MPYTIRFAPKAEHQLRKLDKANQKRLAPHIRSLADDPRPNGCKKLKDQPDLYRIRAGDFRIVYQIRQHELIVLIAAIGNRRSIYTELKRLK